MSQNDQTRKRNCLIYKLVRSNFNASDPFQTVTRRSTRMAPYCSLTSVKGLSHTCSEKLSAHINFESVCQYLLGLLDICYNTVYQFGILCNRKNIGFLTISINGFLKCTLLRHLFIVYSMLLNRTIYENWFQ